jgi:multiple sugar transport system substrate-binding protein
VSDSAFGTRRHSRRRFLLGTAAAAASAILAACGGGSATDTPKPAATNSTAPTAPTAAPATALPATQPPAATTAPAAAASPAASTTTAASAVTGTTAAGSAAPNVQAGSTTITWFAARDATGYTPKLVDAFNRQSKSIQISYQEQGAVSQDLHDKFVTVSAAKDASVDIVSIDSPFASEYAAAGWTIPADDAFPKDEQAKFFKGALDAVAYNGTLYGVPWFLSGPGFFYRKDLLDAAGLKPPKTYDELIATAKKVQSANVAGFLMQLPQTEGGIISWLEYLWGYGGDLVDDKLNVIVDKGTAGVDSMQKVLDLIYTEKVVPEAALTLKLGADVMNTFRSGNAAMIRIWFSNAGDLYKPDTKITKEQWDVTTLPSKDGAKPGPGCLGSWSLGIGTFSKKQKEAAAAVSWLTAPEQQKTYFLDGGFPPTRTAVLDDAAIQAKYPYAKAMQASFAELKSRPVTPYWAQMSSDAVQPNFGAAMGKQKSPDQAIKDMAAAMRKIIKQ